MLYNYPPLMDSFDDFLDGAFVVDEWNEGDEEEEEKEGDNETAKVVEELTKESLTCTKNKSENDDVEKVEELTKLSLTSDKEKSKQNDEKTSKHSVQLLPNVKKTDTFSKTSVTSIKNKSKADVVKKEDEPIKKSETSIRTKSRAADFFKKMDEPIKKSETSVRKKSKAEVMKQKKADAMKRKESETSISNKIKPDVVKKIDEPIKNTELSISNKSKADVVKKIDEPIKKIETSISNKSKADVVKLIDEPIKKTETSVSNKSKADVVKLIDEPIKNTELSISNKSKADVVKLIDEPIKKTETSISNKSKTDEVKQIDEAVKKSIQNKDEGIKKFEKPIKKSATSVKNDDGVLQNEDGANKIVETVKQNVTNIKIEDEKINKVQPLKNSPKSKSIIVGVKKTEVSTHSMSSVKNKDKTDCVETVEEPIKQLITSVQNESKQDGVKIKEESNKESITNDNNKRKNVNKIVTPVQKVMECNKDMRLKEILPDEERDILQLKIRLRDGTTSDVCSCFKDNTNVWRYSCNPCNVREKVWDIFSIHVNSRNHANLLRLLEPVHFESENSLENDLLTEKIQEMQIKEDKTIELLIDDDELKNSDVFEEAKESEDSEEFVKTNETEEKGGYYEADELQKSIELKNENELVEVEGTIECNELELEPKQIELKNTIESNEADNVVKTESKMCDTLETNEFEKTDDKGKTDEVKKEDELEGPDKIKIIDLSKEEVKAKQPKKIVKTKEESSNKKVICKVQSMLDNCDLPLIGLEYLLEVTTKGQDFYYCLLCDKRGETKSFILHFSRQKHYTQYLTLFFHAAADKLNLYYKIGKNHDLFFSLTNHVVARIEHVLGRLQPTQIKKETFLYNKFSVLDKIEKGAHLRETAQQNFVECVNKTHLEKGNCTVGWRGKPEGPKPKEPINTLSSRYLRGDFPARASRPVGSGPPHGKIFIPERQFPTPPAGCERIKPPTCLILEENKALPNDISGRSEEERRFYKFACSVQNLWKDYEERAQAMEENLQKELRFYQEVPEKHPLYAEEWYAYCNRRSAKLEEMGQDPSMCSMNDNWFEFWDMRLIEWFKEIFEKNKLLLREQLQFLHSQENKGTDEVSFDDSYMWTKSVHDGTFKPMSHLSVVTVLKRLSTLKPNLGSLGVKVDDLLASALRLEDVSENRAEELLLVKENCTTLEKIREKLEYDLQSERVQQDKITATESAVLNIIDLLRSASKRQRSSEKQYEDRKSTYTKQVFIRRDEKPAKKSATFKISEINECIDKVGFLTHLMFPQRMSIVLEIAAALFVRGLTEINEDDLFELGKILTPQGASNAYGLSSTNENPLSVPIPKAIDMVFGRIKSPKRTKRSRSSSISLSPDPKRTREKSPIKFRHRRFRESPDRYRRNSRSRSPPKIVTRVQAGTRAPHFLGAPYKFWVRGDVAVGTIIGQVRLNEAMYPRHIKMFYKLLHKYHQGVPFSIEATSGRITVRDQVMKFDRNLFDFHVEVTDQRGLLITTDCTIQVEDPEPVVLPNNLGCAPMAKQEHLPDHNSGELVNPTQPPPLIAGTVFQNQQVFSIPVLQKNQGFIRPEFNQQMQAPGERHFLKPIPPTSNAQILTISPMVPIPSGNNAQQTFIPHGFNPQNQAPGGWNNMGHVDQAPIPQPIPTITKTGPAASNVTKMSNLKVIETVEQTNFPMPGKDESGQNATAGIEAQNDTNDECCTLDDAFDEEETKFCKKLTSGPGSPALQKYERRVEIIKSKLINDMKYFKDNPHKHELYQKELDLFWNIRGQPPTIENRWYIIKSEFVPYWENLLKQLYQDKFKFGKSKLREEFTDMYFSKKPADQALNRFQDRMSRSSRSPQRRSVATKKVSKKADTSKRSKLVSEQTSSKSTKRSSEKDKTKETIKRSRLDSAQSSSKNRTRSPEKRNTKTKEIKKEESTIIPVLRYISVLEKYLDSLGPKLLNIMSEALSIENLNSRGNVESFIAQNSVLLDTIKEKLLGLLEAGIIEKNFILVAENAIDKIDSLLSKVKDNPVLARSNIDKITSDRLPNIGIRNKKMLKITEISKFIENHEKLSHIPYAHRAAISQAVGTSLIYQNILEVSEEDTMVLVQATLSKLNLPLKDDSVSRSEKPRSYSDIRSGHVEDFRNVRHEGFNIPLKEDSFGKATNIDSSERNFTDFRQQQSRNYKPNKDGPFNIPSKEDSFGKVTKVDSSERNYTDYRQQQSRNYKPNKDGSFNIPSKEDSFGKVMNADSSERDFTDYRQQQSRNYKPNKDGSFNIPSKEDSFGKFNKPDKPKSIFQKLFPTYEPLKQDFRHKPNFSNQHPSDKNIPPRGPKFGSSNETQTSNVEANAANFDDSSNNDNLPHNTKSHYVTITPPRPQRHNLFNHNRGKNTQ